MARLGHSGRAQAFRRTLFPRGFGAEVMDLMLETWKKFVPARRLRLEDPITAVFRNALVEAYVARGRDWFVTLEDPIIDPDYGTQDGRNDLRFYPLNHHAGQTVFFTVECKRIHAVEKPSAKAKLRAAAAGRPRPRPKIKPLVKAYVKHGMRRFVVGQYSHGLPCGGMFGYVLDNDLDAAFARVCKEITAQRRALKMTVSSPLVTPSAAVPNWQHGADTVHRRADGDFTIHHVLVGVP